MIVDAVIPALNEEENILHVLGGLSTSGFRRIVLVDNGSTDRTAELAASVGAIVVPEPRRGYGSACLAGLAHIAKDPPETVVFLDADGADDPNDLDALLEPIRRNEADLVIGSRIRGEVEAGALTPVQHFGNALSCVLIRLLFRVRFSDLGPFRAITWQGLQALEMADRDFGWTVEMQAKAARRKLRCHEVPVRCRRRFAGQSKISGTLRGSFQAGTKILYTIGREAIR